MKIAVVSSFHDIPNEIHVLNLLFCNGLMTFNLRKDLLCRREGGHHEYTEERIRAYIERIPPYFRNRIIIHSHFHLVKEYGLKGAHFTKKYTYENYLSDHNLDADSKPFDYIGFSVHTINDILQYSPAYSYLFLSPVFDSISNEGYNSKFSLARLKKFLLTENIQAEIMALGGMNHTKVSKVQELGFDGLSLLGHIWSRFEEDQDIAAAVRKFQNIMNIAHAKKAVLADT